MSIRLEDTPILQQLISQATSEKLPLHVPGHHQGRDLPGIFSEWLGTSSKIDLTELPGLDNLHHSDGCILASQKLAASHYGSKSCFYSVNGSTAGIMAAIRSCASLGQKILFLNPFHLSAWRGIVQSGAIPAFLPFVWDESHLTFAPPLLSELAKRLEYESDFSAIYLTSPTYQGGIADVHGIVQLAHHFRIPVIVDEAHGAHLGLGGVFPHHSVHGGADIVVQSAHKTLPSLTQSAWVHVQGNLVHSETVMEELNFLQTTSPSYLLMASLDVAQAWLRIEGATAANKFIKIRQAAFPVNSSPYLTDPLRHWVPIGNAKESKRLEKMLHEQGIYVEIADVTGILAMFGFFMAKSHFEQLKEVLDAWQHTSSHVTLDSKVLMWFLSHMAEIPIACSPREAYMARKVIVPLNQSAGRICGELVTPYPPGVPILLPGQKIDKDMIEGISSWLEAGYSLTGLTNDMGIKTIV